MASHDCLVCPFCGYKTPDSYAITLHIEERHIEDSPFAVDSKDPGHDQRYDHGDEALARQIQAQEDVHANYRREDGDDVSYQLAKHLQDQETEQERQSRRSPARAAATDDDFPFVECEHCCEFIHIADFQDHLDLHSVSEPSLLAGQADLSYSFAHHIRSSRSRSPSSGIDTTKKVTLSEGAREESLASQPSRTMASHRDAQSVKPSSISGAGAAYVKRLGVSSNVAVDAVLVSWLTPTTEERAWPSPQRGAYAAVAIRPAPAWAGNAQDETDRQRRQTRQHPDLRHSGIWHRARPGRSVRCFATGQ